MFVSKIRKIIYNPAKATYNLFFWKKYEKIPDFYLKIFLFFFFCCKIFNVFEWACFRNELLQFTFTLTRNVENTFFLFQGDKQVVTEVVLLSDIAQHLLSLSSPLNF